MTTGNRINSLRKQMNMTLKEVAAVVGVTEATIQRYESGKVKVIPYDRLAALADLFGCTPGYIMGWESGQNMVLSDSEAALISAYRRAPEGRRDAIRTLLNI